MKKNIFIICLFFIRIVFYSQTYSWTGYTSGSTSFSNGNMSVAITGVEFANSAPKLNTPCSTDNYLNIQQDWTTATKVTTVAITFATPVGAPVTFSIKDINSEYCNTSQPYDAYWFDQVLVTGVSSSGAGILPTGSNLCTNSQANAQTKSNSTNTLIINADVNTSSGISGCSCTNVNVSVGTAGTCVKNIYIVYRNHNSSGAIYSGNPKNQFIGISPISSGPVCSVLPIELLSFNAKRQKNNIAINWQTASEKNNDYYTIERSLDGINFEEIKRVKGAGNSFEMKNYHINDENPRSELSYYRLKQTDFNGQYKYSDIVSVESDDSKVYMSNVYPNPTSNNIEFDFYTPFKGELAYEITDYTGRVLISKSQLLEIGHSKINTLMDELLSGIYFLKTTFDKTNLVSVNKIVKN